MKRQRNSFLTPLVVEVMPEGTTFRVFKPFTYYWKGFRGEPLKITVPIGFKTDFASIPPVFRLIIPKLGKWNKPAVIHDRLYQDHIVDVNTHRSFIFSRYLADRVFLDGMADTGVKKWKRNLMYLAVRLCGSMAWRKRS